MLSLSYQSSSLLLLNSLFLLRGCSFKGTFWIYSLWICWRKTSISSQAKALKIHVAVDIISQSDILLQEHRNITLSQWGWECADEPLWSPEGFPCLALMCFSPPDLFHSKIPWNSNLARKEEKITSSVPIPCTPGGTDTMPMGLGLYKQVMTAPSCCPGAGERICRLLPGLRVYLFQWNDGRKPKQKPRTGSCVATLVSSPPEHLGLAVLLSGPLLPPSHGTTLSCVPCIATAAVQLSCALYPGAILFSSSQSWGKDLGFQRCCELSVSLGKRWALLLCWTMSTHHAAPQAPGCGNKEPSEDQDHKALTLQWFNFNPALCFSSPCYGQVRVY